MSSIPPDLVLFNIDGPGNRRPDLAASATVTLVLAIASVALRFHARRISRAPFWWDDWLMLPALATAIALEGIFWWLYAHGYGEYIGPVTVHKLKIAFIAIFIDELLYSVILAVVKYSVLALCWRLFRTRWARIYVYVLAGINSLWLLASIVATCMECQPTSAFWNRLAPGSKCMSDFKTPYIGTAIITIVTDVAMVLMPIYLVWNLKLSKTNRLLLCGVFASGLLTTIISGVRLNALVHFDASPDNLAAFNIYWNFVDTGMWSLVEANMAIVSGNLPCLRPILKSIIPKASKMLPLYRKKGSGSASNRYADLSGTTKAGSGTYSSKGLFGKAPGVLAKEKMLSTYEMMPSIDQPPPQVGRHNNTRVTHSVYSHSLAESRADSDNQLPIQDTEGNTLRPAVAVTRPAVTRSPGRNEVFRTPASASAKALPRPPTLSSVEETGVETRVTATATATAAARPPPEVMYDRIRVEYAFDVAEARRNSRYNNLR